MARFSKEQAKAFVKENNLMTMDDVQSALKELFAETLQSMLEAELDTELGYEKHDVKRKRTTTAVTGRPKRQSRANTGRWKSPCHVTVMANLSPLS